jgi:hypothetical protein
MKVTVYRPKQPVGLGTPQGFLGEEHPTQGDWVQSAKNVQPDGIDPHMMIHQMGRDFLIYTAATASGGIGAIGLLIIDVKFVGSKIRYARSFNRSFSRNHASA